jgi:hypothetical protein
MGLEPIFGSSPLLFSLEILYTVRRTPWTGDQPGARPLPTHRITQTFIELDSNLRSQCLSHCDLQHIVILYFFLNQTIEFQNVKFNRQNTEFSVPRRLLYFIRMLVVVTRNICIMLPCSSRPSYTHLGRSHALLCVRLTVVWQLLVKTRRQTLADYCYVCGVWLQTWIRLAIGFIELSNNSWLHFTNHCHTQRLLFSVIVFTALLGNGFQRCSVLGFHIQRLPSSLVGSSQLQPQSWTGSHLPN